MKFSRGMVFGVFDGFHPGHQYFLEQASEKCDELVVVVTLDDVVLHFKHRLPKYSLAERMEKIKKFGEELVQKSDTDLQNTTVVPGDTVSQMGEWLVLKKYEPDVVFIGYDQQSIATEMARLGIATITISAHFPDQYKSSIINK